MAIKVKFYILKTALIIALFVIPVHATAQNKVVALPANANHQIEYIENLAVPKTSQSELFRRALNWAVTSKAYKFKKIDLMDNGFGRIMASARFIFGVDEVFLSVAVDIKDNKAQLKITRFDYNMMVGNIPLDNLANNKTKEARTLIPQTAEAMKTVIKSWKDAMLSTAKI